VAILLEIKRIKDKRREYFFHKISEFLLRNYNEKQLVAFFFAKTTQCNIWFYKRLSLK